MKKFFFLLTFCFFKFFYAALPQKVIICGVCKDVEERLPYTIRIMEKIGSLFSDYRILVYENNSLDKTPLMLKKWKKKNRHVEAISEKVNNIDLEKTIINRSDNKLFRPEAISRARNIVLDKVMSAKYDDYKYVIWIDMDFKLEPDYQGFIEIFQNTKKWDAVFAYGIDPDNYYWDWYAFRDRNEPFGPELLGKDWFGPKNWSLNITDAWYKVYSAFGGCGIYKKSSIKGCRYSALVTRDLAKLAQHIIEEQQSHAVIQKYLNDTQNMQCISIPVPSPDLGDICDPSIGITTYNTGNTIWRMNSFVYKYPVVCEHVTFHSSMIAKGYDKLFISPRLIFRYGE